MCYDNVCAVGVSGRSLLGDKRSPASRLWRISGTIVSIIVISAIESTGWAANSQT